MAASLAPDRPTLAALRDVFRDVLRDPALEITPYTTPDDLAAWDSLAQIGLIVEIEYRFDIRFAATEVEQMCSVAMLLRAIEARRAPAAA